MFGRRSNRCSLAAQCRSYALALLAVMMLAVLPARMAQALTMPSSANIVTDYGIVEANYNAAHACVATEDCAPKGDRDLFAQHDHCACFSAYLVLNSTGSVPLSDTEQRVETPQKHFASHVSSPPKAPPRA